MRKMETTPKGATDRGANTPYMGQALKNLIMSLVVMNRMEVEKRRKSPGATDEQLAEKVLARVEKEKPDLADNKESLKYYETVTREVVWNDVNATESEHIISRLKSGDRLFTQKFFYGTNNGGCNISRFRSKIIAQIRQIYHYDLSVEEFGNILYTHLWNKGTWSVLDNYAQKSSFFCWLEQVARHEVMKVLEEMKVTNVSHERTVSNTRLLGASVPPEVWNIIITDLMPEGTYKELLTASYVNREDEKKTAKKFNMDTEKLRAEIKKAEDMLKDRLIRSGSYYENLVLRDKTPHYIEVSEEFVKDFVKWQKSKSDTNIFADIFGVNLDKEEVHKRVVDFLYHFSDNLQWSEKDKMIWRLRFIEDVAPVEVAERCGKARAWLDTRYSRLNKKFNAAIRKWWKNNS